MDLQESVGQSLAQIRHTESLAKRCECQGIFNNSDLCGALILKELLPFFGPGSGLEFYVAAHNIGSLGIRRLLEGHPGGDLM